MTAIGQRRRTGDVPAPTRGARWAGCLLLGAAAVVVLSHQVEVGPSRPEMINPLPAATHTYAGVPRGTEPWLGVEHWPAIMQLFSLAAVLVFFAFAVRASWGQRVWSPLLVLGLAFVISSWMDPTANWVSYAAYNPQLLHYKSSWWADASPTVEPLLMAMSYPVVLSVPGLIAVAAYRRWFTRHASRQYWAARHPLVTLLGISWALGWVMDIAFEFLAVRMQIYIYTQAPEWAVLFGGTTYQFPVLGALLVSGMMAVSGPMLWRDDRGKTLANRIGERVLLLRRYPNGSSVAAACMVITLSMLPFYSIFGAVRITHQAREISRPWVFQELKVYDPHGDYQRAGEPGPYFGQLTAAQSSR
jgi:hypothetical protein